MNPTVLNYQIIPSMNFFLPDGTVIFQGNNVRIKIVQFNRFRETDSGIHFHTCIGYRTPLKDFGKC